MTDFRDDMTPETLEQIKAQLLEREKLRQEVVNLSQQNMAEKLDVKRWAIQQVLRGRPPRALSDEDVRLIDLMQTEKEAIEARLAGLTIRAIARGAGCSIGKVERIRDEVTT